VRAMLNAGLEGRLGQRAEDQKRSYRTN
jgi:hypothetical protein